MKLVIIVNVDISYFYFFNKHALIMRFSPIQSCILLYIILIILIQFLKAIPISCTNFVISDE